MNTLAMTRRIIHQIAGDKRTLALLFVAPIFALYLLSIVLGSGIEKPDLEVLGFPEELRDVLAAEANVTEADSAQGAIDRLKTHETDGLIEYENNRLIITVEGSDSSVTAVVMKSVSAAVGSYMKNKLTVNPMIQQVSGGLIETETVYIYGSKDFSTFDRIAPMMMGFFIFFFVFLLAGVSFLRERISGTLERLVATPIRRGQIVMGYFFGFGVFTTIQTIIIQLFMTYGLGIHIQGNPLLVLLINVLLAAGSLSLGTLLSAFAKNEFQLFQFIPIVIVPQILFSGILPLKDAPIWVIVLSKIFPLTYGADALSEVALRGSGFSEVAFDIALLTAYAVLFIFLNSLALKKYRRL